LAKKYLGAESVKKKPQSVDKKASIHRGLKVSKSQLAQCTVDWACTFETGRLGFIFGVAGHMQTLLKNAKQV